MWLRNCNNTWNNQLKTFFVCFYRNSTIEHVGGNQATPNVDFNATTNNSVIIPSGETSANITLAIFDDPNPELSELFDVELEHVELVGQTPAFPPQLGALKRAAVTIVTSDDAHGLMVIKAANPDAGSHGSRTTVNETDSLSVVLVIERLRGKLCDSRFFFLFEFLAGYWTYCFFFSYVLAWEKFRIRSFRFLCSELSGSSFCRLSSGWLSQVIIRTWQQQHPCF